MKIFRICPTPQHSFKLLKDYKGQMNYKSLNNFAVENNLMLPKELKFYLEKLGHKVFEASYDLHPLQNLWAVENGFKNLIFYPNPPLEIITKQIEKFDPDVILVFAGALYRFDNEQREIFRNKIKNKNYKIVGFWGDEMPKNISVRQYFGDLEHIICATPLYEKMFKENDISSSTLGSWFFDPHSNNLAEPKNKDFKMPVFIGDTGFNTNDHLNRFNVLNKLFNKKKISIYTFKLSKFSSYRNLLMLPLTNLIKTITPRKIISLSLRILNKIQKRFPNEIFRYLATINGYMLTSKSLHVPIIYLMENKEFALRFNVGGFFRSFFLRNGKNTYLDYLNLLNRHFFHVNLHRDEIRDFGNIRCFEVTGTKNLLFSDNAKNLGFYFEEGKEFVGFENEKDLIEKIDYYKNNIDEAKKIAEAGYKKTIQNYTVKNFAEGVEKILKTQINKNKILVANYDLSTYPTSFDFAFFIEYALMKKEDGNYDDIRFYLIKPFKSKFHEGINSESENAVDLQSREYRYFNICVQLLNLYNVDSYSVITKKDLIENLSNTENLLIDLEKKPIHHREFYQLVNKFPTRVRGYEASVQARRYIKNFLKKFNYKKFCSITLRYYKYHKQRNSNLIEWQKTIDYLEDNQICPIIIPDTDQFGSRIGLKINEDNIFWEGCFDLDLRNALYEESDYNLFVNNGPATLATLNKNIKYCTFKFIVKDVEHCTKEFIESQGYKHNKSPSYANEFQNWSWNDDNFDNIKPYVDKFFFGRQF